MPLGGSGAEGAVDHGGGEGYEVEGGLFVLDEVPCWWCVIRIGFWTWGSGGGEGREGMVEGADHVGWA
jgi:hypothetical protein